MPLRAFTLLVRRHDPDRRPREAVWLWTVIVLVVLAGGVLGYAIPALYTWWGGRAG